MIKRRTVNMVLILLFSFASGAKAQASCRFLGEKVISSDVQTILPTMELAFDQFFVVIDQSLDSKIKNEILTSCHDLKQLRSQTVDAKVIQDKGKEIYGQLTSKIGLFSSAGSRLRSVYSELSDKGFDYSAKLTSPLILFTADVRGDGSYVLVQSYDFCQRLAGGGSGLVSTNLIEQESQSKRTDLAQKAVKGMFCSF